MSIGVLQHLSFSLLQVWAILYTRQMAVASLIISILAVLAAGASVLYTRQQAQTGKRLANIEHERYLEQQSPRFAAWVEDRGGWQRLWLRLESSRSLDQLQATLVEADGISFTHSQNGVDPSSPAPIKTATWGRLDHGDKACWRVDTGDGRPSEARLRIVSRSDDDITASGKYAEWTTVEPVKLPPPKPMIA